MDDSNKPLVSIVIPSHNGLPYLKEAIDSILAQTYTPIELIVIDDNSTDEIKLFIKQYNTKLHFESKNYSSQSKTLARGWDIAKGEILGYLSADDLLLPTAVEMAVQYFKDYPDVVLTYCDNELINHESQILSSCIAPDYDESQFILEGSCRIGVGAFFRAVNYQKVGPWDSRYKYIPDYEHQLRLSQEGKFIRIPQVLGRYRIHENATTSKKVKRSAIACEESTQAMQEFFKIHLKNPKLFIIQNQACSNATLHTFRACIQSGRYLLAVKNFFLALKYYPKNLLKIKTYQILAGAFFKRGIFLALAQIKRKLLNLKNIW